MKKYFKYILAVAAVVFAVSACKKVEEYKPGDQDLDGCYGVYFPSQDATGSHTLDPTMDPETEIKLMRKVTKGAITVPVTISASEEGIFNVGEVKFADGQSETTVKISFPNAELGTKYKLALQIEDPMYASQYSEYASAVDYSVLRVEWQYVMNPKTNEKAIVHWNQIWWGETCDTYIKYYEVNGVRTCFTETIAESHVNSKGPYTATGFWGCKNDVEWTFNWYTKLIEDGKQAIQLPYQYTGWTYTGYGDAYTWDNYYEEYRWGDPAFEGTFEEFFEENGIKDGNLSYYDGNGGFYIVPAYYYIFGAGGWTIADADNIGLAEGFTRVDYTLNVNPDYTTDGVVPVLFEVGADIATIKLAGYEGELTKAAVAKAAAAIVDGSQASQSISTKEFEETEAGLYAGSAEISFDASGTYTIIAVGLDENGEQVALTSATALYIADDDVDDNAVTLYVGTDDVSDRYQAGDCTSADAFAFYIAGQGVTEAKFGIFTTANYEEYTAECNAYVKTADPEDEESSVVTLDEDQIAALNSVGGFSQLAEGLKALTSYTVVVWATNGKLDKIATAEYTTAGLPNEVVKEGTAFMYTACLNYYLFGVEDPAYDEGLKLEYNPNTNAYEIPHWGYDQTFTFTVDKDGNIDVPIQKTGVTITDYGTLYVMSNSHCDEMFINLYGEDGEGAADYYAEKYGYKKDAKCSIDEDGNYVFPLTYITTGGYIYWGEEILYINGKPADEPADDTDESDDDATAETSSARIQSHGAASPSWSSHIVKGVKYVSYQCGAKAAKMTVKNVSAKKSTRVSGRDTVPTRSKSVRMN